MCAEYFNIKPKIVKRDRKKTENILLQVSIYTNLLCVTAPNTETVNIYNVPLVVYVTNQHQAVSSNLPGNLFKVVNSVSIRKATLVFTK